MIWWGPIWSIMLQLHRYVLLTTVQSHSTRNKGRCRPISELSEQSPLVSTIRVCQTLTHSSEKLQTQYFPLLETFYFLCLWVLRGRGLLSWVSSMLCAWPTQGESSHPRESVLKVKAGPLVQWLLRDKSYRAREMEKTFEGAVTEKEKPGTTEPHMGFWAGTYSTKVERTHKRFDQNRKILAQIL